MVRMSDNASYSNDLYEENNQELFMPEEFTTDTD
jgi:hypothetical protein